MIRELILFRPFFSLLLLLSFSPFCTYEPTSQIHPKIGDVWVANGNVSMDNVMSTIFEAYKDNFKAAADKGAMNNIKLSYAYDVAVSVVNVPLSAYNEFTGSVNFIAVTVTRTADYV